jgi:transcriptional regulator with XRE-family HTH domain
MTDAPTNLGEAWRHARKAMSMSQEDMAARLGVSESYLSLIENNHRVPSIPLLRRMAQITKRTMEQLTPTPVDTVEILDDIE